MTARNFLMGSVAALAMTATVDAGHFKGWYIGIEGGASWVDEWTITSATGPGHKHTDTLSIDSGWAAMATVGYAFHNNFRLELEAGYRSNDIDDVVDTIRTGVAGTTTAVDASLKEFSVMANVLYDIQLSSRLSLSLGAGVGADKVDVEFGGNPAADVDEWKLAYQGIVGLNYAVGNRTDLFVNYRYLHVGAPDMTIGPYNSHAIASADDLTKHAVTVGLRFDLHPDEEPAPPPPPPPPPMPPKSFVIFFGYNKCNITREANAVLSEAANAAKSMGSASVRIVGHTDSSGSNAYNQKLSECRASAAKANLASKGVPEGAISTSGRGESELQIQTGDGVKEPQNRRATVDLN